MTGSRQPPPPAVVLVRPQEEGNVGACARAMANMGLERLLLVEPAPPIGATARAFAVGAGHVLDRAKRHPTLAAATAPFQRLVGTSSGRDRQLEQRVVTARELPAILAAEDAAAATALVFGPEASGLTRDELALCDPLVVVPCSSVQPTLNLAQAVLVVAYELSIAALAGHPDGPSDAVPDESPDPTSIGRAEPAATEVDRLASVAEVDRLIEHLEELLRASGFERDDTYRGVRRDLRQLAARARPTEREVQILHGICRRTLGRLAALQAAGPSPADE